MRVSKLVTCHFWVDYPFNYFSIPEKTETHSLERREQQCLGGLFSLDLQSKELLQGHIVRVTFLLRNILKACWENMIIIS